jgi:hypothetical protein
MFDFTVRSVDRTKQRLKMLAVKGRYNGATVVFDSIPPIKECDVIVNFPDISMSVNTNEPQPSPQGEGSPLDDGSLAYLFKNYVDDGIRKPIIDFGGAVGNEQW